MIRRPWPLGIVVVLPAVAIAALVLISTWPMLSWPYPRWVQTSAQWHQRYEWTGIIAGTAACYYAFRLNAADRIWTQPHAPRLGAEAVASQLGLLVGWLVGAYVLALLPLTFATALHNGIGSPSPLVMLSGVLAMTAAVGAGYVLGTVVPSAIIVPITGMALFLSFVISGIFGDEVAAVSPVLYLEPQLGQAESTPLVVFRIALYLVITLAAASLAARILSGRSTGRRGAAVEIVAHALVPVVLVAVALSATPALFTVEQNPARVCEQKRGIDYCVHQANEPQLPGMIAAFDPIFDRYGSRPATIRAVWDEALVLGGELRVRDGDSTLVTRLGGDGVVNPDVSGVVEALLGIYGCPPGADNGDVASLYIDLTRYLSSDAPPSGVFAGMSQPQMQDWIRAHQDQLRTCTLNRTSMPRP